MLGNHAKPPMRFVLLCQVVDHWGDIGVCYRLAKILVNEYSATVALVVDDLIAFNTLEPSVLVDSAHQVVQGIQVWAWCESAFATMVASWQTCCSDHNPTAILATFACETPAILLHYLRSITPNQRPLWINIDYLSAEPWVEECHGLPSPQHGLEQYFYFPGFTPRTGGLMCERTLKEKVNSWVEKTLSPVAQPTDSDRWNALQILVAEENETLQWRSPSDCRKHSLFISLFCYPNPRLPALLKQWQQSSQNINLFVPIRVLHACRADFASVIEHLPPGQRKASFKVGNLWLHALPMLSQEKYDALLAMMDINFVRGEDSLVRALWAGVPLVWQIYPQPDRAHDAKLGAFLDRYQEGLSVACQTALVAFFRWWNDLEETNAVENQLRENPTTNPWQAYAFHREQLQKRHREWAESLLMQGDFAQRLMAWIANKHARY